MHDFVLGRFPPPLDGQTMATRRLAELLEARHRVTRIDVEPPETGYVAAEVRFRPERVRHYLGLRGAIREALAADPEAPVLWTSISPAALGHWRDVIAIAPQFRPGQRVYGVVHRAGFDRLLRAPLTRPTARRLVRRLAALVFLDEDLSEACAPWVPAEKRVVIPNTVDEAVLCTPEELSAKHARRREQKRLLFLSNMMPEKGYLDVVRAVGLLQARGVDVHATFAGRWVREEDRTAFEGLVRALGIGDRIEHLGGVADRARVKRLHLDADVFLLPSYHPTEAQPIAVIEALAAGTPVVTTRHGGMPRMVRDDREALLVPPRDPEGIAEAVTRLSDAALWRRLSEGASRRFDAWFSPDAVRARWLALLEAL